MKKEKIKYVENGEIKYVARDKRMDSIGIPINANTIQRKKSFWFEFWDFILGVVTFSFH